MYDGRPGKKDDIIGHVERAEKKVISYIFLYMGPCIVNRI